MRRLFRRREATRRRRRRFLLAALALVGAVGVWHACKPLPPGLSVHGAPRPARDLAVFFDRTYHTDGGERVLEQQIFDEVFALIDGAQSLIVADQFLFNDFQGPTPETSRALSSEMTARLIARKRARPAMRVVLITDPVNTLYGGRPSAHLDALADAGVEVVLTDLPELRDSHLPYSPWWRTFAQMFGNEPGGLLPNPLTQGTVSLRTYLSLLNFKANHRKTLIVDRNGELTGLVSSANPHDGSAAHDNLAVRFGGLAALDLLASENAVLAFSGGAPVDVTPWRERAGRGDGQTTVTVLTESAIRDGLIAALASARDGDAVDVLVFYLSHEAVIDGLLDAHQRGASVRVLLDPNKDAFGREKNGLPNRAVAHRLVGAGVPVRWCATRGEQCHAKLLLVRRGDGGTTLITGSANFTRRNLDDLNLETDVQIDAPAGQPQVREVSAMFDAAWSNTDRRIESVDYSVYADDSRLLRALSWWMERSGMSTF